MNCVLTGTGKRGLYMDKKVLIVEDERILAEDMKSKISDFGLVPCGIESNGENAIAAAKKENPDLIIMDIKLKGDMDGIETVACIREFCQCPVIFITAFINLEKTENIKSLGNISYLVKPYYDHELQTEIEKLLKNRQ